MGKLYSKAKCLHPNNHRETLLYAGLWGMLFLAPLLNIYFHHNHSTGSAFPWNELLMFWKQYAIFLAAFLLHNYLLAPLLIYRQRKWLYFSCMAALLTVFVTYQCLDRPHRLDKGPHHLKEQGKDFGAPPPFDDGFRFDDEPPAFPPGEKPDDFRPHLKDGGHHRPGMIGEHDIVATIIFILMIGMNLGVKLYFRQRKDQERMAQLEHENLEQQLEYLKYQINPHFLMNTLNNIHALVDIDPEQAKETIVELSKIMRFVLYEGSKQKVPLRQELLFLENYIELMRMRVAEQVNINVALPDIIPDREIPPLLLITFVENAFKHGVSYQQKSFIDISIFVEGVKGSEEGVKGSEEGVKGSEEGVKRSEREVKRSEREVKGSEREVKGSERGDVRLVFECRNSKIPKAEDRHGGVGLQNARRRLDLLYADRYTLDIDDAADTYTVKLSLPL